MMNWILLVMAGIAAALIAVVVGGLVTPTRYTVRRRIQLRAAPAPVRELLRDAPAWSVWTERAINVSAGEGSIAAPSAVASNASYQLRVIDDDMAEIGSFTFAVEPDGFGSLLECTEQGVIRDPLTRFVRTHLLGLSGNTDAALRHVAEQLDEFDATPVAIG